MSDPIQHDFECCRLGFLNSVLPRIPVEDDVQLRNISNPATINLTIKFDPELHESQNSTGTSPSPAEIVGDRELDLSDFALDLDTHFRFAVGGGEEGLAVFGFVGEDEPEDLVGIVSRR